MNPVREFLADLPQIIKAAVEEERARLGMVECPNCEEGTVCGTDTGRDPDGSIYPIPVQEPCPTCGASGFVPACLRTAMEQAVAEERERLRSKEVVEATLDLMGELPAGRGAYRAEVVRWIDRILAALDATKGAEQ